MFYRHAPHGLKTLFICRPGKSNRSRQLAPQNNLPSVSNNCFVNVNNLYPDLPRLPATSNRDSSSSEGKVQNIGSKKPNITPDSPQRSTVVGVKRGWNLLSSSSSVPVIVGDGLRMKYMYCHQRGLPTVDNALSHIRPKPGRKQQVHAEGRASTASLACHRLVLWMKVSSVTSQVLNPVVADSGEVQPIVNTISYKELLSATEGFLESNILGRGGFGTVYKGCWKDTTVAIKRLHLVRNARSC